MTDTLEDLQADLVDVLRSVRDADPDDLEAISRDVVRLEAAIAAASAEQSWRSWSEQSGKESDPWPTERALQVECYVTPQAALETVLADWTDRIISWQHGDDELVDALLRAVAETCGLPPNAWAEPEVFAQDVGRRVLQVRRQADGEDAPGLDEAEGMDTLEDVSNTDYMYAQAEAGHWATMPDHDGYKLPGCAQKYTTCGLVRFMACENHDHAKRVRHNCGRLSCHVCVRPAASRIARKLARRTWLWRHMIQSETQLKKNPLPSHVIESIPANSVFWTYSKSKQARLRAEFRKIAGLEGGVSISHLWRFTHDGKKRPRYSPHEHLLVYGWVAEDAYKKILERYGIKCIYHKVKNGTMETEADVFRVALYLLSHCAVRARSHSYKWFGDLSYAKISNEVLDRFKSLDQLTDDASIEKSKSCPHCGARLVPARLTVEGLDRRAEWPPDDDQERGCAWPPGFLEILNLKVDRLTCYNEDWTPELVKTRTEELELYQSQFLQVRAARTDRAVQSGGQGVLV